MAKNNINTKKGFTIIEVVLVLAIAGLIFLMVFVALPALQRSQRDTSRRNDMSRVDTSLVQYQTNHSDTPTQLPSVAEASKFEATPDGSLACSGTDTVACEFVRDYMNSGVSSDATKANTFQDPDGEFYNLVITPNVSTGMGKAAVTFGTSQLAETTENAGAYTIKDHGNGKAYDAHVIYIVPGGKCAGDTVVDAKAKRHFAVLYRLEGAGVYCIDDQ